MSVQLKRAYEAPSSDDGKRFLVDRLWPRGLRREKLQLTAWLKELAPSTELRRWYNHEPGRWEEFRSRYEVELLLPQRQALLNQLAHESRAGAITLVFAAKDVTRNEAVVLERLLRNDKAIKSHQRRS